MALVIADRIQETTATTGTGTYTLAGAKTGFASFSGIGDGNTTYYACTDGTDFEVGIGTYTASGTTLARTTILASTNSNNAVDWGAGSKDIFVTLPAAKTVIEDASNNITIAGNIANTSGDFTLDVAGDIILDADDAEIIFKDGGTQIGRIRNVSSGEFTFQADVDNKDIVFNGKDDGSTVTALTLDMSDAGAAIFNSFIYLDYIRGKSDTNTGINIAGSDVLAFQTGGSERVRIGSSGEMQYGGTTNAGFIDFDGSSLQLNTQRNPNTGSFQNTGRAHQSIVLSDGNGTASNGYIRFMNASSNNSVASESGRFNSAGDLLLGTTDNLPSSNNVEGIALSTGTYSGYLSVSRSGDVVDINRKGSNGALIVLRKDGSNYGKIGVNGDDNLNIFSTAADHAGLEFATHLVAPLEAGSASDGTIDLGASSARFKDLYLSGTVTASSISAGSINSAGNITTSGVTVSSTSVSAASFTGTNTSDSINFGSTSITLNPNGNTRMTINDDGKIQIGLQTGATGGVLNIDSNDGNGQRFIHFTENGSGNIRGGIGETEGDLFITSRYTGFRFDWATARIVPCSTTGGGVDNSDDLGYSSARWDDIYATNGTINTSDEREKQQIASLTNAEITAATAISKLFKTYKWKDKVASKGDAARTHTGMVAQQVQAAMSDAGLDASKYAFWCENIWWQVTNEDGTIDKTYETEEEAPEGSVKKERLGIRYPELLAFIGAATEQRLTNIEARLTALEG